MAADPVFIDANVLIYATRRTASEHALLGRRWLS
jgi:predicted nucleic acid-binding protein